MMKLVRFSILWLLTLKCDIFKKLRRLIIIFKLSSCPKILHLNVSGLKMTPFPFQPSISSHDHLL